MNTNTLQVTLQFKDDGSIVVDSAKKKIDDLDKSVKGSTGGLGAMSEGWIGLTAKITAATAAVYGVSKAFVQIASATSAIERQAKVFGISTDELQKWNFAARMSDVNAQELAFGIKWLSMNMEGAATGAGDANKYFSAMGVSVKTTHGNLRPLNDVMGDIMDKFASWQDGPRKIAIAMQLFGRSGETLTAFLNQGRRGMMEFSKEADKIGQVLGKDILEKGSEANKIFEKLDMRFQSFKLNLAPTALEFAKFFDQITPTAETFRAIFEEINRTIRDIKRVFEGLGIINPEVEIKRKIIDIRGPKIEPPEINFKEVDLVKEIQAAIEAVTYAEEQRGIVALARHELEEGGWSKEKDIVEQVREELARLEEETNRWGEITVGRQDLVEAGWEKVLEAAKKNAEEQARVMERVGGDITSIWTSHLSAMRKGQESFAEGFKNTWLGMADYAIQQMERMALNYALFGSASGKSGGTSFFGTSSGGYGGLIGGVMSLIGLKEGGQLPGPFIPIKAFQGGGYVDRPTLGLIGEGGEREWIVPESKMGRRSEDRGGDTTINMYVEATDVDSFERKYGSSVTKIIHRNKKSGGMRG